MAKSLAQAVRELLEDKPYFKYALETGVVNYSALAKEIGKEVTTAIGREVSQDAIGVSIRRYAETLGKVATAQEKELLSLLKKAQINLKNNIADITFKPGQLELNGVKPIHTLSGSSADVLIINQEDLAKINVSEAIEVRKNLVEISIITDPEVEKVTGFVQYVTGLLAENNINIIEVISCYIDTILILEEKDAMKAYEILNGKLK